MKLLILGGSGMLGHRVWMELSQSHDVWGTVLGPASSMPTLPHIVPERIIGGVDALHFDSVIHAFGIAQPEVVINCIGLVKQHESSKDPLLELDLNARLPHQLAALCKATGSRLIHVSTDCVFTGAKGNYTEDDPIDAQDLYGRCKALGEVTEQPHALTMRTSLIGRELISHWGLVEWFLSQQGPVKGYQKAIFTGFPTQFLAAIIRDVVLPDPTLHGLYHVSCDPISKFDLITLIGKAFNHPIEIQPDATVDIDRSLNSSRFRQATGFQPLDWPQMVAAMAATWNY